ncbi:hypothetical protein A4X13_0g2664 [Tilletia indica]|uniref:Peptidase M20 dimerisation domain-containing protein n=1 Tax=Tilletia indica TaxID=43049 RepID=A0A177TWK5_9BASI|nr:hypothetical protein A4X13_0g2664 [Tilletia indica]
MTPSSSSISSSSTSFPPGTPMDHHSRYHLHTHPALFHSLSHHGASVLAIAIDEQANILYSASQSECIVVWDLTTLQERTRLRGHTASVLALELARDKGWLFSSSGDNTVRIWDVHSWEPVAVLYPAEDNVGDIFSLQWSQQLQTLYVGCQNTSIQWISLESVPASAALPVPSKPHKFFDSVPVALQRRRQREEAHSMYAASSHLGSPGSQDANNTTITTTTTPNSNSNLVAAAAAGTGTEDSEQLSGTSLSSKSVRDEDERDGDEGVDEEDVVHLQFSSNCIVPFAHFGYVYSLLLFYPDDDLSPNPHFRNPSDEEDSSQDSHHQGGRPSSSLLPILASGSGDEQIKLWEVQQDGSLLLRATLHNPDSDSGGILTLAHQPTTLLAGTQSGTIEVWDLETLSPVRSIRAHSDDVLCLSTLKGEEHGESSVLFSSGADGWVGVWDGKFAGVGRWRAHEGLALACVPVRLGGGGGRMRVVTGGSDDVVKIWDFLGGMGGSPPGIGSAGSSGFGFAGTSPSSGAAFLRRSTSNASITGLSYPDLRSSLLSSSSSPSSSSLTRPSQEPDILLSTLGRFISFRSVSSDESYREECRQCAHWLKGCLSQLGAETMLIPGANRRNPLVLATFRGNAAPGGEGGGRRRKRCLFYGHYDVVDDESGLAGGEVNGHSHGQGHGHHQHGGQQGGMLRSSLNGGPRAQVGSRDGSSSSSSFGTHTHTNGTSSNGGTASPPSPPTPTPNPSSEPWVLTGRDGYLYGRGASDNKGPILAVACAAAEMLARRELEMDVVLLVEGEEEVGSVGLAEAVRKARGQIGEIDVILLSNSYWLGEETPCITMGLRGVIHATIEICGPDKDVHSGVQGGALREPMIDMVRLLSTLSNGDEVLIPNFYDAVRPVSTQDLSAFASIASSKMDQRSPPSSKTSAESLIARWCRPSLSIHRLGVSGSGNATVIPSKVEAAVSLRIVPDMDAEEVGRAFEAHVGVQFGMLGSGNRAKVRIDHRADWWLGSAKDAFSQALADAIEAEWGEAPVSIREGGSIPAMALLEKELGAPAVHLPMGQSSDNAHLPGERIRLMNLQKGRAVVRRFLEALPGIS